MKYLFLILLLVSKSSFALASRYMTELDVSQRLKRAIATEYPKASRIDLEKLYTQTLVPKNAALVTMHPKPPLGLITFQFKAENRQPIFGNATARVYLKVAVAKSPIRQGERFTDTNTVFEEREITPLSQKGYYAEREDLDTLQAHGYLHPGVSLSASNTRPVMTVSQGQDIDIIHRKNQLEITARGRAMESGRVGDWIQVQNPNSRKVIRARITQPGEAETR